MAATVEQLLLLGLLVVVVEVVIVLVRRRLLLEVLTIRHRAREQSFVWLWMLTVVTDVLELIVMEAH